MGNSIFKFNITRITAVEKFSTFSFHARSIIPQFSITILQHRARIDQRLRLFHNVK